MTLKRIGSNYFSHINESTREYRIIGVGGVGINEVVGKFSIIQ